MCLYYYSDVLPQQGCRFGSDYHPGQIFAIGQCFGLVSVAIAEEQEEHSAEIIFVTGDTMAEQVGGQ